MTNLLQIDDLIFDKSEDQTSLRIYHRHLNIDFTIDDLSQLINFLSAVKKPIQHLTEAQIADINDWVGRSSNKDGGKVYDMSQYLTETHIEIDFTTSGSSGGSCWGEKSKDFDNDVSLNDVTIINKILNTIEPNISAEKSRKIFYLLQSECPSIEKTENEYYGNYSNTITWNIPLEILYKVLNNVN